MSTSFIKTLLLTLAVLPLCAGAYQYSGFVKNKAGAPIATATVSIKGTSYTTSSNAQGAFSFSVAAMPGMVRTSAQFKLRMLGNTITLTSDLSNQTTIRMYDLRGRNVASARSVGRSVTLPIGHLTGFFIIEASSGSSTRIIRSMLINGRFCNPRELTLSLPVSRMLAKSTAAAAAYPALVNYLEATRNSFFRGATAVAGTSASNILITLIDSAFFKDSLPYKNPALSFEARARDLLSRMTRAEKLTQMSNASAAIPRFGIKAYNWMTEALHGLNSAAINNVMPTCFPQSVGIAAMWDPDMTFSISTAISEEARVMYHYWLNTQGYNIQYQGIAIYAPVINIFRDPLWGRGSESFGEDPWLTAQNGVAYIRGLQGDDPTYFRAIATPKHLAVFSGPGNWSGVSFTVSESDLRQTYLPAFKICIKETNAHSIMCAYSTVNNVTSCENTRFLKTILRGEWGFKGFVATDFGAGDQGNAIRAGCDNYLAGYSDPYTNTTLTDAVLDTALFRTLLARFKMGMFDPQEMVLYSSIPATAWTSPAHDSIALEAARRSIVLLKNKSNTLPLAKTSKIAVIGPHATQVQFYWGNYYANNWISGSGAPATVSILQAIQSKCPAAAYSAGCRVTKNDTSGYAAAVALAKGSDVVVFVGGSTTYNWVDTIMEDEFHEKTDLNLPAVQDNLLRRLQATGKPVVFVMLSGSGLSINWANDSIPALVEAWYPGQEGGKAVADVLFGDYNPGGKLPVTFYKSYSQCPGPRTNYNMTDGWTYRYLKKRPQYSFGFGLSYTTFAYSNMTVSPANPTTADTLTISAVVKNTGTRAGDEVVQTYSTDVGAPANVPVRELEGFKRISLAAGAQTTVSFRVAPYQLSFMNASDKRVIEPGAFTFSIGGCQPDSNATTGSVLTSTVTINGTLREFDK